MFSIAFYSCRFVNVKALLGLEVTARHHSCVDEDCLRLPIGCEMPILIAVSFGTSI